MQMRKLNRFLSVMHGTVHQFLHLNKIYYIIQIAKNYLSKWMPLLSHSQYFRTILLNKFQRKHPNSIILVVSASNCSNMKRFEGKHLFIYCLKMLMQMMSLQSILQCNIWLEFVRKWDFNLQSISKSHNTFFSFIPSNIKIIEYMCVFFTALKILNKHR